jgi:hypothetical protein
LKQTLKKLNWLYIAQVIVLVVLFTAPTLALAQLRVNDTSVCDGTGLNCSPRTANQLIRQVINWLLGITFGVAVLFLIIGGFQVIISGGNPEGQQKGKNTIINAVIGIVIIVLSYVIVNAIASFVSQSGGSSAP